MPILEILVVWAEREYCLWVEIGQRVLSVGNHSAGLTTMVNNTKSVYPQCLKTACLLIEAELGMLGIGYLGRMDWQTEGLMDVWTDRWMDRWMDGLMDGRTEGWMTGRMDKWTDVWINEWTIRKNYLHLGPYMRQIFPYSLSSPTTTHLIDRLNIWIPLNRAGRSSCV